MQIALVPPLVDPAAVDRRQDGAVGLVLVRAVWKTARADEGPHLRKEAGYFLRCHVPQGELQGRDGVRAVVESAGITNILTQSFGSTNPINIVKATFEGLSRLRTREEVAWLRGVELS